MNAALFSSASAEWSTPKDLFAKLAAVYPFDLDVCATPENAKVPRFFSRADDGLAQPWRGVCWMNPPYGDPEHPCKPKCSKKRCQKRGHHVTEYIPGVRDWVAKAAQSASEGATVVCLLPARTDTRWFHQHCYPVLRGERPGVVRFLSGRLKFGAAKNSAPFPSVIVVFKPLETGS